MSYSKYLMMSKNKKNNYLIQYNVWYLNLVRNLFCYAYNSILQVKNLY